MTQAFIDTDRMAARLRAKIIRPDTNEILISRLGGSRQESDLTSPVVCAGLGRVRHFTKATSPGWPKNFLPMRPASRALGRPEQDQMEALVFQNAACAWRCWYCYVPFELLGGDERKAKWVTPDQLVSMVAALDVRPAIIDLSGGSPDLTPEWVPWMLRSLDTYGLADTTYLWSDDNLSTDYVFNLLSNDERRALASPRYGRVCCFKGFDEVSFSYNTGAHENAYDKQFERFARYLDLGIDLWGYVTLTGPNVDGVEDKVRKLVERLDALWPKLIQRTVPLRIAMFGPTQERNRHIDRSTAMAVQERAISAWNEAVANRRTPGLQCAALEP